MLYEVSIWGIVSIALFFVIQNPMRDALINTPPEHARFALLTFNIPELKQRLTFISGGFYTSSINSQKRWYLTDIRILIAFLFAMAIGYRSKMLLSIVFSSLIILLCSFIFYDYYWPANGRRMILTSYQLGTFGLGFLAIFLITHKDHFSRIFLIVLIAILVPQTISSHLRIYNSIRNNSISNITFNYDYHNNVLDAISPYVNANDRILFFDGYPLQAPSSTLTSDALLNYGMLVPTAPADIKITNVDSGSEWYDFMLSLNPRSVKELSPTVVYISSKGYSQLPEFRKRQINSSLYLSRKFSNNDGTLYSVKSSYSKLADDVNSFYSIMESVPDRSAVYVDIFDYPEIRRGLILRLSRSHFLYGAPYNYGGDFYMHIEYTPRLYPAGSLDEMISNEDIHYLFLNPVNVSKKVLAHFTVKMKQQGITLLVRTVN